MSSPTSFGTYAGLWLRKTASKSWGSSETFATALGASLGVASHFYPPINAVVSDSVWVIPIFALVVATLFRLIFLAPYALWKEEWGRSNSFNDQIVDFQLKRNLRYEKTNFVFQSDEAGSLTPNLLGFDLFHRNVGEQQIRYTLARATLEVAGGLHELNVGGGNGLIQSGAEGWHRCLLVDPILLDTLPVLLVVDYDYEYDTIPPSRVRTSGATMRFLMSSVSPSVIEGAFFDEQREN